MKILIDTSAYVGFKQGLDAVIEIIVQSETILLSPVVLGELLFGFRNGSKLKHNMNELAAFMAHAVVVVPPLGEVTADRYARIASQLRRRGTPIPTNDIWIAAQTMEHGAELITMDKHFQKIPGLIYSLLSP